MSSAAGAAEDVKGWQVQEAKRPTPYQGTLYSFCSVASSLSFAVGVRPPSPFAWCTEVLLLLNDSTMPCSAVLCCPPHPPAHVVLFPVHAVGVQVSVGLLSVSAAFPCGWLPRRPESLMSATSGPEKVLDTVLQQAMESLLRTVEDKGFLDADKARVAGFCPLRFIAEYLMRHNPAHGAATGST